MALFETLYDGAQRGELLCLDGGMCHYHLRQDGQLTIREIIATQRGTGSRLLRRLLFTKGATSVFAKCPSDLPANAWYEARGFVQERTEQTPSGRWLTHWRFDLTRFPAMPTVGALEVIYCADGNARMAEIALDAGLLYGARLPATIYYRPYFVDQDYRHPDRARFMAALAEHRPRMATVLDLQRWEQLDEVLSWAEEAAQYAETILLIPKAHGIIARLPRTIGGKPVRLAFSVDTSYGATTVALHEFDGWPVHLLGGRPEDQLVLARMLQVVSVDCNYTLKMANNGQFWLSEPRARFYPKSKGWWPTLREAGEVQPHDAPYEAFRRSCTNQMVAWGNFVEQAHAGLPDDRQLALPIDPWAWEAH